MIRPKKCSKLNVWIGLQTPRLKRLAEIVSAQAIAQQEKLEYGNGEDYEGPDGDIPEADEAEEAVVEPAH